MKCHILHTIKAIIQTCATLSSFRYNIITLLQDIDFGQKCKLKTWTVDPYKRPKCHVHVGQNETNEYVERHIPFMFYVDMEQTFLKIIFVYVFFNAA